MQAVPMAGVAADAFAALFAGIVPDAGDGRQAAAEGGKALPVVPPVAVAAPPVLAPVAPDPVVAPVLPVSASEAIAMVPAEPNPAPAVRDAVPVVVAAAVVGALKLLPDDAPVTVRQPDPKPEPVIQPTPARFAPPLPVRARRVADEPALPTPDSDDAEAVEDGDAPILVVANDAPRIDLPPMVAIPADALAPVPEDSAPEMKVIGPKVADATVAETMPPSVVAGPTLQGDGKVAPNRPAPSAQAAIDAPHTPSDTPEAPVADPVATMPTAARPVRTAATRQAANAETTARRDASSAQPVMPDLRGGRPVAPAPVVIDKIARADQPVAPDVPGRPPAPPVGIGNIRRSDQPAATPTIPTAAPAPRFAPVDRGAQPGAPIVDPVRPAWQVGTPDAPVAVVTTEPQPVVAPAAADPIIGDVSIAPNDPVAQVAQPVPPVVAQALPPTMQPQPVQPETVAPVAIPPVVQAAPRRAAPIATARAVPIEGPVAETSRAPVADASVPVADPVARPAERASIAEPVRAPIADAAPRPAYPVVIDQPAVAFTLPTGRAIPAQPVAQPLTANRQTIAGEASAPVVSVAAPTAQPKAPPVTRVASAPAPEAVAEAVLADGPAPRPRRDDDAPPLPTLAAPAIDAATLRPVSAPVTAQQPHLDTRQPQWMEGMIDRIETLRDASPTQGETRIRLSPDALGDVEIALRTSEDGRVHVHFSSDNADAGRLLADAQPRLVQLAEARGLKLGGMQVDVGTQQQPSQRQAQDQGSPQPRAPRSAFADAQAPSTRTDNRIA
ncbi:flagellar hook-length control protein FliK [Sphingomonas sp. SAFR-052]|uniref:flagellar hook-length control protein FliK n=1 Tax=Sphingomonas sp. SAFR-052 TaxID=3436867 RepID=UPI003F81C464